MPSWPNLGEYIKSFRCYHQLCFPLPCLSFTQAALLERQGQVQRQGQGEAEVVVGTISKLKQSPHESGDHS